VGRGKIRHRSKPHATAKISAQNGAENSNPLMIARGFKTVATARTNTGGSTTGSST
jgi:hypothetical protein